MIYIRWIQGIHPYAHVYANTDTGTVELGNTLDASERLPMAESFLSAAEELLYGTEHEDDLLGFIRSLER